MHQIKARNDPLRISGHSCKRWSTILGNRMENGRWKGTPKDAVQQAKSALQNGGTVGHVQQRRGGLGLCQDRPLWKKATLPEQWRLVVLEDCW